MKRRPGIQGLQRGAQTRDHYKQLGEAVQQTKLEHMKAQMAVFKKSLEEFAIKHRNDVRQDPVFRAQFHTMCANVGVDPLASNKGMWAQLLGFGDFYYELGVQIVEACLATRAQNGGLMDLEALQRYVQRRRGSLAEPVSEDDIIRAIDKLKKLGGGYAVFQVGKQRLVRSVPGELNTDKNTVLELAQGKGYVSQQGVQEATRWSDTRTKETLWSLLKEGLAMLDDGAPDRQRLFWFPCLESASSTAQQQ
ncbi:hypothetical protein WJX72_001228 [[Myrmecia] bisecta]|uniref:Vacuolar protein sorting-associated protein n=1 Tax=[Myrmecia] bisecta TaxID=41462 RepID=A0AAW1PJ94_9CHLO